MKTNTIKLNVFAIHRPFRAPNERYRFEQYRQYLLNNNVSINFIYLLSEKDDFILFYSKNIFLKIFVYIKSFLKRIIQILSMEKCDTVVIYRELHWFPFGLKLLLKIIRKRTKKIIYDFDDAIWLSSPDKISNLIKQPYRKTKLLIQYADIVIVGNPYLGDFAKKFNKNVSVIPTVVDTEYFQPIAESKNSNDKITIGWMGSHTTIQHLKIILPALKEIQKNYPFVQFKFIAKKDFLPEINTCIEEWNLKDEITTLNTFDIGIMPLPNDEWSKGKCGLKLLTYLSCEIPCVASDVGVNREIIEKTNGGILVNNTQEEWTRALSQLIESPEKRINLGKQGRKGIEQHYSVQAWKNIFLKHIIQ